MNEQKVAEPAKINKIERDAINFAKLMTKGPKQGQKDPLMKIERHAINKIKAI